MWFPRGLGGECVTKSLIIKRILKANFGGFEAGGTIQFTVIKMWI